MSKIGSAAGGAGAGASTGAAIGSAFPGYGTAIGAGVGALVGTVGGLLGNSADMAERRKQILLDGIQQSYENQKQASANLSQGQQDAMNQLLSSYQTSTR